MIRIIDDFFEDKDLRTIQNFALTKAFYTPRFLSNSPEKQISIVMAVDGHSTMTLNY